MDQQHSPWQALGTPEPRVDGPLKVTGTAPYTGDLALPRQLHAVLVQSTISAGLILTIETAAAERSAPGVQVFTHQNLPPLHPPPPKFTESFPAERRPPLSDAVIHYAGQHVALVLAPTLEQAQAAAALVRVQYRATPPTVALTPGLPGTYQPDHFATNAEEKLQSARGTTGPFSQEVTPTYRTPVNTHNPMEPSATVAVWDGPRLTLHDSTRWLQGSQRVIAAMLGVPEPDVTVLCPFVGGAFGSKGFLWQHVALAAQAARATGRPVKLVLTRQQMFTSTGHRPRTVQHLRLAAAANGTLASVEHHTLTETSPVAHYVEPASLTSSFLYTTPHSSISHSVSPTNLATPCFMRAPGESPGLFALESAIDELAFQLHLDPLVLRQRNNAADDQERSRPFSSKHLDRCYTLGAERFGWSRRSPEPRSMRAPATLPGSAGSATGPGTPDRLVGYGMATASYPARRSPCTVRATLQPDGLAVFSASSQSIGTGTTTAMCQIASTGLGLPLHQVTFLLGDSAFTEAPVAGASQTAASVGSATAEAALALRHCILEAAAADSASPLHGLDPATLTLAGGVLRSPSNSEPLSALLARHTGPPLSITASSKLDDDSKKALTFQSFGVHFVEVHVDPDFGEVRVQRVTTVLDCGRILNHMGAHSQVLGGVTFGIGMALFEQTVYDHRTGNPVTADLAEYLLATCADIPTFDIHFIEEPDTRFAPLGNRGVGEIPITGLPAAIANAVFHATGNRVRDLPLTPERVLGLA